MLFGAGLYAHAFLYNFYLEGLGLPESTMGLAAAALTAGSLAALAPAGVLVDRRGARSVFVVAATLDVLGLVAGALVAEPLLVYAAAFVAGLGTGAWQVAVAPTLMGLAEPRIRARAFSVNVGLIVGSGALWTAGAGWVAELLAPGTADPTVDAHRWTLVLGAVVTAASVPLFLAVSDTREAEEVTKAESGAWTGGLRALALPPALAVLAVLVAIWMLGAAAIQPFMNLYFERVQGFSIGGIGGLFGLSQALTAVAVLGSGEIAQRVGTRPVLGGWITVFGGSVALLAAAVAAPLAVGLFVLFHFVGPATNPLIDQMLQERAPPGKRGTVSTWRNAAAGVSGLVGAGVGGWLLQGGGFPTLFGAGAAVGIAGGVALVFGAARTARRGSGTAAPVRTAPGGSPIAAPEGTR